MCGSEQYPDLDACICVITIFVSDTHAEVGAGQTVFVPSWCSWQKALLRWWWLLFGHTSLYAIVLFGCVSSIAGFRMFPSPLWDVLLKMAFCAFG